MTFSFADPAARLYGLARLTLADGGTGQALAVLFADGEAVATLARDGIPLEDADFERLALPGVRATVDDPLQRWTVRFDAGGEHGFALSFQAESPPAELGAGEPAARAAGLLGYEQLCRVGGTVRIGARTHEIHCLGQRGHVWGVPAWERIDAMRVLAAWLDDGTGVVLRAVRPAAAAHGADASWAAVLGHGDPQRVDEPRLSTTYDDAGRQRRAGLELWVCEDDARPQRAAGEVLCRSTLELACVRLDCAFVRWRMGGRRGVGRYDVLRRA